MKKLIASLVALVIGPAVRREIEKRDAARAAAASNFSKMLENAVQDFIRAELKQGGSLPR
jgi:hypothetical protein